MTTDLALLILGLVLLVGAGDALVRGAVALSLKLGIPALIVSLTVVAFGTSAPELLISIKAAIDDAPGIALGNVVGSNIANVWLVLGVPALLAPIAGSRPEARRMLWLMLFATALFTGLILSGVVRWWGGLVLLGLTAVLLWDSVRQSRRARAHNRAAQAEYAELGELEDADPHMRGWKVGLLIGVGLIGLPIGAQFLIDAARALALDFGVSEAAIGLTVVALGTSLPELATTVMAALRREADVAIGNVVGSNLFNITAVIGAAAMFSPLVVPPEIISRDIWLMILASLMLAPFVWFGRRIGRRAGTLFCAFYGGYVWLALVA